MASSSKPTAIHFFLVAFVLCSLILGLLYYVTHKSMVEAQAARKKAEDDSRTAAQGRDKALERVEQLKKAMGPQFEEVGDAVTPNTVLGTASQELTQYAPEAAKKDYSTALALLDTEKRTVTGERDSLRREFENLQREYQQLKEQYNTGVAAQKNARDRAEQDTADTRNRMMEEIAKKEKDLVDVRKSLGDVQVEYDAAKEAWEKSRKEYDTRVSNLNTTIRKLTDELSLVRGETFEQADGVIRWVDNVNKLVWINVGKADNLSIRTSFSVYRRANTGVGRALDIVKGSLDEARSKFGNVKGTAEDLKGAIEVTRILGPHMAEARISKDDIYNPIAVGDPIYTPIWSPGRQFRFTMIGLIDIDGNGQSDRDRLREFVQASGGVIDNDLDEKGNVSGEGVTEETKFVVLGKMPDLKDAATVEEQALVKRIYEESAKLKQQAREHGVRIISLSDFLSWIGYTHSEHLFVPGGETPFKLPAGAASKSADDPVKHRKAAGKTSGLFSGDQMLKPKTSKGTTSKVFGGGR